MCRTKRRRDAIQTVTNYLISNYPKRILSRHAQNFIRHGRESSSSIRWIATPFTSTSTKIYRLSNRLSQRSCWKTSNRKIDIWRRLSRSNSDFITAYLKILIQILGILSCLDGFMNIALEQTEEYVNGAVTNRYGDAFVRGNNGAFFSPSVFMLIAC